MFFNKRTKYLSPGTAFYPDGFCLRTCYTDHNPEKLTYLLGVDALGTSIFCNIADAPSVLIAGAPGSGKSVCINTLLYQAISTNSPRQLEIYIADPKRVDYIIYKELPHVKGYQVEADGISAMIDRLNKIMLARYDYLAKNHARKLDDLSPNDRPPRVLLVFDELATMNIKPIIATLENIARLGRAVGVHMILATQNPKTSGSDANMTSTLKACCPCKISFRVDNVRNSLSILDVKGAEMLAGKGDGLVRLPGKGLIRFQGEYIRDNDIECIIDYWKRQPLTTAELEEVRRVVRIELDKKNRLFLDSLK